MDTCCAWCLHPICRYCDARRVEGHSFKICCRCHQWNVIITVFCDRTVGSETKDSENLSLGET
jgi:hypothetical protein